MPTSFETFVVTELPRRPTLLTYENTGYFGDPNLPAAPAIIQGAPKGSLYIDSTLARLWRKSTSGSTGWVFDSPDQLLAEYRMMPDRPVVWNNTGYFGEANSWPPGYARVPVDSPLLPYLPPGFIPNVSIIDAAIRNPGNSGSNRWVRMGSGIPCVFCCSMEDWPNVGVLELIDNGISIDSFNIAAAISDSIQYSNYNNVLPYGVVVSGTSPSGMQVIIYRSGSHIVFSAIERNTIAWTPGDINIHKYQFRHNISGISQEVKTLFIPGFDRTPTFVSGPVVSVPTQVTKWLSGIECLTIGTQGRATGIISACIGAIWDSVAGNLGGDHALFPVGLTGQCCDSVRAAPFFGPTFRMTDTIPFDGTVTVNRLNTAATSFTGAVQKINRVQGAAVGSTFTYLAKRVNTYVDISTNRKEQFNGEARRIVLNSGTYSGDATPWNSAVVLVNGNAQIASRNGVRLTHPANTSYGDYSSFSGDQEYQRFMYAPNRSKGILFLRQSTQLLRYGTGYINALMHLTSVGKYFDFLLPVGQYNGDGSGNSEANSIGCLVASSLWPAPVASTTPIYCPWDISPYGTAAEHDEYRLILIVRNTSSGYFSYVEEAA